MLLLLPFFTKAQTQQKQLYSLHVALGNATNDTVKMITLYQIAEYYAESNRDSALFFAEQAVVISKQIRQPIWTANLLVAKSYFL